MSPVTIVLLNVLRASQCSPIAILAQLKNCPFGFKTTIELKNITSISDNTSTRLGQNIPSLLPLLSLVTIMFLSSIVILTPNGQFLDCANIPYRELHWEPEILRDFDNIWSFSSYFYAWSQFPNIQDITTCFSCSPPPI